MERLQRVSFYALLVILFALSPLREPEFYVMLAKGITQLTAIARTVLENL